MASTVLVFLSDHGLHYGPYFPSQAGERERNEPLLYLHSPRRGSRPLLYSNQGMWTTPFDVHSTILELLGLPQAPHERGLSLLHPLPDSRRACTGTPEIPPEYCPSSSQASSKCTPMPLPPSVSSFYADMPSSKRGGRKMSCVAKCTDFPMSIHPFIASQKFCTEWCNTNGKWGCGIGAVGDGFKCDCTGCNGCRRAFRRSPAHTATCRCDTGLRSFPCALSQLDKIVTELNAAETFVLQFCEGEATQVRHRVLRQPEIAARSCRLRGNNTHHYNIMFIQVDSVSAAFAERHFARTRGVLTQHHVKQTYGRVGCPGGLCGVNFKQFNAIGAASVVNQIAVLSGCMGVLSHELCINRTLHNERRNQTQPVPGSLHAGEHHLKWHRDGSCLTLCRAGSQAAVGSQVAMARVHLAPCELSRPEQMWEVHNNRLRWKGMGAREQKASHTTSGNQSSRRLGECLEADPGRYHGSIQGVPLAIKECAQDNQTHPLQDFQFEGNLIRWQSAGSSEWQCLDVAGQGSGMDTGQGLGLCDGQQVVFRACQGPREPGTQNSRRWQPPTGLALNRAGSNDKFCRDGELASWGLHYLNDRPNPVSVWCPEPVLGPADNPWLLRVARDAG